MKFVRVASVEEFPRGRGIPLTVGDDEIAVWRADGEFFAVSAICRHHHVPTLHQGILEGRTVACPLHGWTYSLETGEAVVGAGRLERYEVKVEHGVVFVGVPDDRQE